MSPFALPNPDSLLMPEQKFCILSSVSYAALVLGQLSQGKLFMDQAKQYLPTAMSSVTMDAAAGFYQLALCHLMENDNVAAMSYLKVCKNLSSAITNAQSTQGKVAMFVTGPYESKAAPQSVVLKLRYYYAATTAVSSYQSSQKTFNKLARFTKKCDLEPWTKMLDLAKVIFNIRSYGTEQEVLDAFDRVEDATNSLSEILNYISTLYIHMFRAMKYSFLQDYNAMNYECDQFINIFKNLPIHDNGTIKITWLLPFLWSSFKIPSAKIQEIVSHAQHLSVNYPGYKCLLQTQPTPIQDPLGLLVHRRLTCSEESLATSSSSIADLAADLPLVFDDNFSFDEILGVSF
jgi:hypothetical protein